MKDLSKLCIHTITTKPWSLEEAIAQFSEAGIEGITVWQDSLKEMGAAKAGRILKESPLHVISYCRGGFFPHTQASNRQAAIDQNKQMIEEAAEIGAPLLVLVCGANPDQPLETSRAQIKEGIAELLTMAESHKVQLAIEPLHPMYADTRSAINTLKQANDMASYFDSPYVGIAVDVYHLWWDSDLEAQIKRCGDEGNLIAFHICDWRVPTEDLLLDRGIPGEGCIPLAQIKQWVQAAGFTGFHEIEVFSNHYWSMDQSVFLEKLLDAYQHYLQT